MTILDQPLLVTGRFRSGDTGLHGFYTRVLETRADWDSKAVFPYLLDQDFVSNPKARLYFSLFMKMIAAVIGEAPATPYKELLEARSKPLFETLKDQPATLQPAKAIHTTINGGSASGSLTVANGPRYARLVRIRAEWSVPDAHTPYVALYGDNYFDLMPREAEVSLEFRLARASAEPVAGHLIVEGSNLVAVKVPITLGGK